MSKKQNNDIDPALVFPLLIIGLIIYLIETYGMYILIALTIIVTTYIIYFITKKIKEKGRTTEKPKGFRPDYEISPDSQLLKIWKSDNIDAMSEVLLDEMVNKAKLCRVVKNNKTHDNNQLIRRIVRDVFPDALITMKMVKNIHYYNQKLNYIMNKSSTTVKKEMDIELKELIKAQKEKDKILN